MSVAFSIVVCCCFAFNVVSHAFILDKYGSYFNHLTNCSNAEMREHCHGGTKDCKREHRLSGGYIYHCECQPGFHGASCEQGSSLTSTLAPSVATQAGQTTRTLLTTHTSTAKTDPQVNQYCNRYSVVGDLSHGQPVSNGFAPHCPSGSYASTEAFVLNNCNVSTPDMWHQGKQVMSDCNSIPKFTAVGTYLHGYYPLGTGLSGVLLECLPNGFSIALQVDCDQAPEVRTVEQGGIGFLDPNYYYTIA